MPFISIIVPVYNVEPYIERCFQSVVSQTYRNYEIIFVDDCGTDKSIEILQRLIDEYNGDISLRLIHHEKNKGLSAARNSGIKISSGDYVYFVDSDDYIFPESLKVLTKPLLDMSYDLIAGRSLIKKNGKVSTSVIHSFHQKRDKIECYYLSFPYLMGLATTACNHLYSQKFLKNNNIIFYEGILYEDNIFNINIFCHMPNFIEVDHITYFYEIRENSITTTQTEKHFNDEIKGTEILEDVIKKNNLLENQHAKQLIVQRYLRLLIISVDYGKEYFRRAFDYIRKRGFNKKEWSAIPFKHKLLYVQCLMPRTLAYIYTASFVWLYRTFIWKMRSF